MIPGYCYECMNRQMQMNDGTQANEQFAYPMQQTPMQQGDMTNTQAPNLTQQQNAPIAPIFPLGQGTPIESDINYTQAYLRTKIGSKVKIEFLIGTNMLVDREGTLLDVGISYLIIRETETDDELLCDIYSIKFVRFYL
jgi:hypothetical protein